MSAKLQFPQPPPVRRLNANVLRAYWRTKAAFEGNAKLQALLSSMWDESRPLKCHTTMETAVLQLPVKQPSAAAVAAIIAAPESTGWALDSFGRSPTEQERARKVGLTWIQASAPVGPDEPDPLPLANIDGCPTPAVVEADSAVARHTRRVAAGASTLDPDTYKKEAHYPVNVSLEDIYGRWDRLVAEERRPVLEAIVKELHAKGVSSERELSAALNAARKLHHMTPRKSELLQVYLSLVARRELKGGRLRQALIKKHSKSESGVLVVTVLTAPHPAFTDPATGNFVTQSFSCEWNCYYCPNEPGQPRSYLHDEPSVLRANMNRFDPVLQFEQ